VCLHRISHSEVFLSLSFKTPPNSNFPQKVIFWLYSFTIIRAHSINKGSNMTKFTILSIVAASVLFTAGCSDETKKAAAETTKATTQTVASAAEDVKTSAQKAVEAAKEKAAAASDVVAKKAAEAKVAAANAVASAKEVVAPKTESAEHAGSSAIDGKALFAKCAACHGKDGKQKALGKSNVIAGQSADEVVKKLEAYKAGTRNVTGMGMTMKAQVSGLNDAQIKAVAGYISTL